jgi:cell division septation protein DedD
LEIEISGLAEFVAEDSLAAAAHTKSSGIGWRWLAAAAAAALTVPASIGAPAWYSRAHAAQSRDVAALIPAPPAKTISQPIPAPLPFDASVLRAAPAVATAPITTAVAAQRNPAVTPRSGYSILVASFQNRDRAEKLVAELVNAGYGARTVERTGGPTGRLMTVTIGGYTSAIDVQRDLQRIRELPGYADARIVEQD